MPRFSREYLRHLQSPAWRAFCRKVKARDKYQCVQCGSRRHLEVDHLHYRTLGRERLDDCQTLCHTCHVRITRHRRRQRKGHRTRRSGVGTLLVLLAVLVWTVLRLAIAR